MNLTSAYKPCKDWLLKSAPLFSCYGRKALKRLLGNKNCDIYQLQLSFTELKKFADQLTKNKGFFDQAADIFVTLRDLSGTFTNIRRQQILGETELFEIKTFSLAFNRFYELYHHSGLKLRDFKIHQMNCLIRMLNPEDLITSSFYIYDAYSKRLGRIRKNKHIIESEILREPDPENKEPLRLKRSEIVSLEKQEEFKIREKLSKEMLKWLDKLEENANAIGYFELMLAKAVLARRWPSCFPNIQLSDSYSQMKVTNAINPEIAENLEARGKDFTPVSIKVQPGVTVITGANMGGKTVALMTIAMNTELVRYGFCPYAESFSMPLFDFICFNSGDSQNYTTGLSSFGAEVMQLSEVSTLLEKGVGLVIFDEFARSTNPFEGSRFVQALCEYLQQHRVYAIVATHYDGIRLQNASYYQVIGLKSYDHDEIGCADREKLLDRLCENMDYRLKKVEADYQVPKDALHIANMLISDQEFIKILKKHYV
ncbi:MAG: MutS-related protein [Candidatus Rifleibacteriota bacterium]